MDSPEEVGREVTVETERHMMIEYGRANLDGRIFGIPNLNLRPMMQRVVYHGE